MIVGKLCTISQYFEFEKKWQKIAKNGHFWLFFAIFFFFFFLIQNIVISHTKLQKS